MQDKIVILEEGNRLYPRCPQCDMFVPQKALNGQNIATAFYIQLMYMNWRRLAEEEAREVT